MRKTAVSTFLVIFIFLLGFQASGLRGFVLFGFGIFWFGTEYTGYFFTPHLILRMINLMRWCSTQVAQQRQLLVHCKVGKNRSPSVCAVLAAWMRGTPIAAQASWAPISPAFLYEHVKLNLLQHNLCMTPFMHDYGSTFYFHPGIWVHYVLYLQAVWHHPAWLALVSREQILNAFTVNIFILLFISNPSRFNRSLHWGMPIW